MYNAPEDLETNRIYESAKLSNESQKVVEFLSTANMDEIFEFYISCMNIDHVDFVIKGHYGLGQISTILDHVKISNDYYFGVNNDGMLFECMFKVKGEEFELYKITNEGYRSIEGLF